MTTPARTTRAKPMSVEDRRAAIAAATVPLLIAHGRDVTTRQIAEASGVAEGTLFRVFADKEAIVDAAVEAFLDPGPFREAIRAIDPSLPLELKLELVIDRFRDRFSGIFGVFHSLGTHPRPPVAPDASVIIGILEALLEPDLDRLRVPPAKVFALIRLIAFSSAMPHLAGGLALEPDELASLVVHGIERPVASARTEASARTPAPTPTTLER
ncbi:TetR/AcrR family transcriptional regulator [Agromyces sp. MMS24-JH15]|uniref:TetR/AcrR family transcriptional regulator n=1 Tax=Agromyces sp. MMS24-JH15 TaxID=3243765 RepID=UPI003749F65E